MTDQCGGNMGRRPQHAAAAGDQPALRAPAEGVEMSGLQPLDESLNSECRALAEGLRELFNELTVSVRRYAARCYTSPGTVSRYLSGIRIPQWDVIDELIRHVEEERGCRLDRGIRQRLRALHLAALRTNASISKAVQELEGQLKAADTEARLTGAREEQLDQALDGYQDQLASLELRLEKLETDRDTGQAQALPVPVDDRDVILAERDALASEVDRLERLLDETRKYAAFTEARCNLLERQLTVVEHQRGTALPEPELVQLFEVPQLTAGARPKVLLVDDQPPNLLALEAVLDTHDYQVVSASSGREALRTLLESEDFAVIILDVQMPEMDGYETAADIKRRARTRDIPIIFLTAIGDDPEYSMRGYAAGAVDFIVKPFDPWALRAKVAVFVEIYLERRMYAAARDY